MIDNRTLAIDRLGPRGEGLGRDGGRREQAVLYAVPGDVVEAEGGHLTRIVTPSPDRIAAFCRYFGACGGCAVQTLAHAPYAAWKRGLVVEALAQQRIEAEVAPLIDAHGAGRRRATFHSRLRRDALERTTTEVGFMRARAHDIVDIEACPVLAPELADAPGVARRIAQMLAQTGKPLDIQVTASLEGLDVDVRGAGKLEPALRRQMAVLAQELDLARLSNHGDIIVETHPPLLRMGRALPRPPPGAFLQATEAGEETLAALVGSAMKGAGHVADLFAGVGTFALRLAQTIRVHAAETEAGMVAALERAAHTAEGLKAVSAETRDLFRRPLAGADLKSYDAVVFDPPRSGAEAQARALAASDVPVVVAVSCNAQTFARDARLLIDGGYRIDMVTPVDQFRHSPHVEIVAAFTKRRAKSKTKGKGRSLLG